MTDESVTISNISDAACFVLWSTFLHFVQCILSNVKICNVNCISQNSK